jgi:hypothetical protein
MRRASKSYYNDGRTCPLGIGRVCVKIELHAQIHFYIVFPVNTID